MKVSDEVKALISANLPRLREKAGLSPKEAAEKAGLTVNRYKNIESGKSMPRIDAIVDIAQALDCTSNDIIMSKE